MRWISIVALACTLGGAACANSEGAGSGAGGATGGAGTTGAAGTTGSAGTSGTNGASGTSGSAGGGGSAGADAGAETWSCVEVVDTLCFCNQGSGDTPRCGLAWTCCFAGPTSCQCLSEDEATCTATIGMNAILRRVPACPP